MCGQVVGCVDRWLGRCGQAGRCVYTEQVVEGTIIRKEERSLYIYVAVNSPSHISRSSWIPQ